MMSNIHHRIAEEKFDRQEIAKKLERRRREMLLHVDGYDDNDDPYRRQAEEEDPILGSESEDEYFEAMNRALSSTSVAWKQRRRQWQTKTNVVRALERVVGGGVRRGLSNDDGENIPGATRQGEDVEMPSGTLSHPVMLTDPRSLGYDTSAYLSSLDDESNGNRTNHPKCLYPMRAIYVSRSTLRKRRMLQIAYILTTLLLIMIVAFVLEQLKLSNYALFESPMSLSAYLSGERTDPSDKVSVDSTVLLDQELDGIKLVEEERKESLSNVEHGSNRYNSLRNILIQHEIIEQETLDNPLSPQYSALNWMAYEDLHPGLGLGYGHDDYAIRKMIQRYALSVTYYATNGPGWYSQLHFLSDADECEWNDTTSDGFFIGAGECNQKGFVTALALWSNNLMGALPQELGILTTLTTFSLYDNDMRGPPPRILEKLTNLRRLYLNKNQFQGDLDFMCKLKIEVLKSDCGERGGVTCSCCECGYNENKETPLRYEHGKNP